MPDSHEMTFVERLKHKRENDTSQNTLGLPKTEIEDVMTEGLKRVMEMHEKSQNIEIQNINQSFQNTLLTGSLESVSIEFANIVRSAMDDESKIQDVIDSILSGIEVNFDAIIELLSSDLISDEMLEFIITKIPAKVLKKIFQILEQRQSDVLFKLLDRIFRIQTDKFKSLYRKTLRAVSNQMLMKYAQRMVRFKVVGAPRLLFISDEFASRIVNSASLSDLKKLLHLGGQVGEAIKRALASGSGYARIQAESLGENFIGKKVLEQAKKTISPLEFTGSDRMTKQQIDGIKDKVQNNAEHQAKKEVDIKSKVEESNATNKRQEQQKTTKETQQKETAVQKQNEKTKVVEQSTQKENNKIRNENITSEIKNNNVKASEAILAKVASNVYAQSGVAISPNTIAQIVGNDAMQNPNIIALNSDVLTAGVQKDTEAIQKERVALQKAINEWGRGASEEKTNTM